MTKNKKTPLPPVDKNQLLEYGGQYYVMDVQTFSDLITFTTEEGVQEIHLPKYEVYKSLIEVVISPMEEGDDDDDVLKHLKMKTKTPFDFKLAFNTLYSDGILKAL